ncbi:PPR domain-containing protein/PPR_2 domain-containing protein/DYW_deaminase domain-containing protein [Cephalotus follicularis]|uniref:PPR domain-containing protein/PPR_2 domain-containing protein/DYW_deaminase domain-containing protein n=1 Tax=Cephalotus follicularis TaxID=3775 RepID=A0A1Q3APH2_CEPFO|nr:PPR domain-containing protein/PPR_2 domain-containing protein/DYW_deaminase domain-containing protein [Cephalotus follicularis]
MAKTTSSFKFDAYPPSKNHRENSFHSQNGFTFHKPTSSATLVCSNLHNSYATIPISASLATTIDHECTSFNVKICESCEVGNLKKAMELLYMGQKFDLDSRTYCSILQLCADKKSLKDGKQVHSIICDNGVAVEGVLGSKLVFMYVTCGDLREGRRVFDMVANEKVFLWNLMINEYTKIGDLEESICIFKRMLGMGIEVNTYTFSCILKCFAAVGSLKEGKIVHGYLLKLGFGCYNSVVNSLISFYFRCGRSESARKLFDELSDRDVVSWNSMISGYVENDLGEKGLEVLKEMLCSGIEVDLATMLSVLAACADCGTLPLGRVVHALAIKVHFDREIAFNNSLLDMYSKCNDLDSATSVFEKMSERTVVTWTSMIAGYAREGLSDGAIRLFLGMIKADVEPDKVAITNILHACACNGSLEHGRGIHDYVRENNMQSSLFVSNALMDMYAKCGSMNEAQEVFSQMRVKDIISWNTMIGGYSKNSLPNEALGLFVAMLKEHKPDGRTMACILPACASLAALERGQEIHGHILRNGYFSDQHVANALVDMYVKCGVLVLAQLLFDMIPVKDLVSWTVMIAGYGMHGFGREAIASFNEMRRAGIKPDEVSFISILYACSHSGLVAEGWRFFYSMQNEFNIKPKLEHYACMVDLLARIGNLSKAYKFIESMPIAPDATIWGALLRGCRIHHDVELAEKVAEKVFDLEPENTGYYVLLANIYAEAEKWEEVKYMREKIRRRGLRKNPGCSWIDIKGKVTIFVANDKSHPQARKIESLLKKLSTKLKVEGYFPKIKYALINADDMEKEAALCGHSEKLAMALGILSLPASKIIRVTKNLRVCGDCHEMAKFMSKTTKREIVLRDSNRFHHFKNGVCSCRGFW